MTLTEIAQAVVRDFRLVLAAFLIALIAGLAALVSVPRVYEAVSLVYVDTSLPDEATRAAIDQAVEYSKYRTITIKELSATAFILESVIENEGLNISPLDLSKKVTVLSALDTSILEIIVEWGDAATAAEISNAIAAEVSERFSSAPSDGNPALEVTVANPASIPSGPASPNPAVVLGFAGVAGLFAGLALIFLREAFSPRARSLRGIGSLENAPLLGAVAIGTRQNQQRQIERAARTAAYAVKSRSFRSVVVIALSSESMQGALASAIRAELEVSGSSTQIAQTTVISGTSALSVNETDSDAAIVIVALGHDRTADLKNIDKLLTAADIPVVGCVLTNATALDNLATLAVSQGR